MEMSKVRSITLPWPVVAQWAARLVLGGIFLFSGTNAFLNLVPQPQFNPAAQSFLLSMFSAGGGFMYIAVMSLEIVGGIFILSGRFGPLGLMCLTPILVNIVLFHFFLDRGGLGPALICTMCAVYLWAGPYRRALASLWKRG